MKTVSELLTAARAGHTAAIARLLSIVENDEPGATEVIRATYPQTGRALKVGFTGPPGAGKSTLVSSLTAAYRKTVPRVAVVAVDPSSPYTGGAILGDRIRMREQYLDKGVFIRSMSNRGQSGGLSRATRRVVSVLDAMGFDVILVETVGVGQQEIDVVRVVDTVCLLTIPGAGDDIQAIKAGIIEIADLLVVNKADRPGADEAVKDLMQMLNLGTPRNDWRTPVIKTSSNLGTGIEDLMGAVRKHREWANQSGEAQRRNADAMRTEIQALMRERVLRELERRMDPKQIEDVVSQVVSKRLDPYGAVDELLGPEAKG
ncbi:methylmalonyl Co-A mutase-associated GTPase MeaB [Peristeroidobacter soli]|jgi:LAO/AO transport system kinase|uniref:methylmalonyl Co-A mutase-associated GTPase MeaB n=1 Tax=Peristeroidobacter soli TaxID=2497877 RepID=UPI00101D370B|nr:methylmalonyl Co-A mutase-associated GTPase MeaB [Peristeroidobacter soli]